MIGKVQVPQDGGEVTVTVAGGEPRTWLVQDGGLISPANKSERALLLATIDGAKPAPPDKKET